MAIHHRQRNSQIDAPLLGETIFRTNSNMGSVSHRKGKGPRNLGWVVALTFLFALLCFITIAYPNSSLLPFGKAVYNSQPRAISLPPVLVSYSYFEKDVIQEKNFEFFISVGMGLGRASNKPLNTDFVVIVNGKICRPCSRLYPMLREVAPEVDAISTAFIGDGITMLQRKENEGMDFAAHNVTFEWLAAKQQFKLYKYFILLNSSVRGPFVPAYMPNLWQWPNAYIDRLVGDVKAVSSSLVCLPSADLGGFGPKLESWAFAIDQEGLEAAIEDGVFYTRTCKLCEDGVVVKGEYGLSAALMRRGFNIDTLMAKYKKVDWRDERHWHCNNNVHPSRHGTYDTISMHPFETVFIKASWHVGEPFVDKYSEWSLAQAEGKDTTGGQFDEQMYTYAISPQAQESHHVQQCYDVLHRTVQ